MPDGATKFFHTLVRPVVKPVGEVEEYLGVSRDVTEANRAADALRQSEQVARGQVEALVQSLDVLLTAPAPDRLITRMLVIIRRLLKGQWVALWLLSESRESLVLRAAVKGSDPDPDDQGPPSSKPLPHGRPIFRYRNYSLLVCQLFARTWILIRASRAPFAITSYLKARRSFCACPPWWEVR